MMKKLVFMMMIIVLGNVSGGENPGMNIFSGNTITIVTSK